MAKRETDEDDVQFRESTCGGFLIKAGWHLDRTILRDEKGHKTGERYTASRGQHQCIAVSQAWWITMVELGAPVSGTGEYYGPDERELSETEMEQRQLFERDWINRLSDCPGDSGMTGTGEML